VAKSKRKRKAYKGYKRTFSLKDWFIRAKREYYRVTFLPKVIIQALFFSLFWVGVISMFFYVLSEILVLVSN
jgi:hypothetical protein